MYPKGRIVQKISLISYSWFICFIFSRPKKLPNENSAHTTVQKHEDDPCMVKSLTEKLFPQLSLGGETPTNIAPKFAVLKLPTGEKTIELPAIQVAKNYSSILTELVSHMWDKVNEKSHPDVFSQVIMLKCLNNVNRFVNIFKIEFK